MNGHPLRITVDRPGARGRLDRAGKGSQRGGGEGRGRHSRATEEYSPERTDGPKGGGAYRRLGGPDTTVSSQITTVTVLTRKRFKENEKV